MKRVETINDFGDAAAMDLTPTERRSFQRHEYESMIQIVPVDRNLLPFGSGFTALSKDVSQSGLSLECFDPISSSHAVIELTTAMQDCLWVFGRVVRCLKSGATFDVGIAFTRKLAKEEAERLFQGGCPHSK
jgi:hypothetical protein